LTLSVRNLGLLCCLVREVMRRFTKFRYLRIAGFAAGGVVAAGAAVLVTASAAGLNVGFRASTPQPAQADTTSINQAAGASAVCNDFVSHLSNDLGKSQAQVNAAIQKAIGETLADEVKNNNLTPAQSDAIKKKLTSQPPCALGGLSKTPDPGASAKIGAYTPQLMAAAASALGITDAQLKTDLASGMSLSQIAAAQKPSVTEAQFRTNLVAKLKPLLDTAVTNKQLTTTQEQAILQHLQTGAIPFWNTPMMHKKAAPASPAAATAT
jgi:hypothetical protein